jgi:alginate O-acetyltransferase complex protein AlgI
VVFGSLREMKRPRKRRLGRGPAWSASLALRRVGTFTAICILWSLWSTDSIAGWVVMWTVAGNVASSDVWLLAGLVIGGLLVAGRPWSVREDDNTTGLLYRQPALHSTALLLGMLVVGNTPFYARHSPQLATTVASLQRSTLNARDAALQHRGYYEKLDSPSRMSAQLWNIQARKPAHWVALGSTAAYRVRNDFMLGDLRPNTHVVFEDQPLTTNSWGMRDHDRLLAKPEGTYRIAVLGPSHVMGSGVGDGETFTHFLEERLNRPTEPETNIRYEVINFGVADYSLLQQLAMLEQRAVRFQPDAVFITDGSGTTEPVIRDLLAVFQSGFAIPYPELDALIRRMGVTALANPGFPVPFENVRALLGAVGIKTRMPGLEAQRRLRPAADSLVRWTLGRMAAVVREHGAVPVFVSLDIVVNPPDREITALQDAAAAGFLVFNLLDLWQNRDKSALRIAEWDEHPNAAGNRVIADRLFELMRQHRSELRLGRAAPQPAAKSE